MNEKKEKSELEFLRGNFILLDTNILIDAIKYQEQFGALFSDIRKNNCSPVVEPVIEFEFYRGARNNKELCLFKEFIEETHGKEPDRLNRPNEDTFKLAQLISAIAYRTDNKALNLADCIIAAQIAKYVGNNLGRLFLATQNHSDFPPAIFDRVYTKLIELPDGKLKTIGIYAIDNTRFKLLRDQINF